MVMSGYRPYGCLRGPTTYVHYCKKSLETPRLLSVCSQPVGSASVYGSFNNSNQHNGSQFGGLSNPGAFPNTMPSTSNTSPVNNSTSSISGIGLLQQKTQDVRILSSLFIIYHFQSTMRDVSGDSAGGRASAVDGKSFFKMARSR